MLKMEQKMCESNQENSIKTAICRTAQAEPPRLLAPSQEPGNERDRGGERREVSKFSYHGDTFLLGKFLSAGTNRSVAC